MGNYDEYYEKVFGDINIGDKVRVYKEGTIYEGELIFKNKYYITLQLPYYREGFSIPDFLTTFQSLLQLQKITHGHPFLGMSSTSSHTNPVLPVRFRPG